MPINNLLAGLVDAANCLVQEMEGRLGAGYPKEIKDSISIGSPQSNAMETFIEITLGGQKAPMAAAFEWGSGLRAVRGDQQKYPIRAKNAPLLGFLWQYPSPLGLKVRPKDEWVAFPQVMHPGIAPKPYIEPSIRKVKDDIRRIIGQAFVADIRISGGKFPNATYTVQL